MANSSFVSADIEKLSKFEKDSVEAIKEFNAIKKEFGKINSTLLKTWDGAGSDAYRKETDHILEKIGSVEEVLKAINEGVVKTIKDNYNALDHELADFNKNPEASEGK